MAIQTERKWRGQQRMAYLDEIAPELSRFVEQARPFSRRGRLVSYIPELLRANPHHLGITLVSSEGKEISAGDYQTRFTLQSISKVFSLALALMDRGTEEVLRRVGMEPTGDSRHSLRGMLDPDRPLNPMLNAGAILTTSLIRGKSAHERVERLLSLIREMSGNPTIAVNEQVYLSEKRAADRNRAIAYLMKSEGLLRGNVLEILDAYFQQCAVEVTTRDLAHMAICLARGGRVMGSGKQVLPPEVVRILLTLMFTSGMYDASGEFAIRVGIPAKSGVSGGIMAVVPGSMGIGIIGPALDDKGNSVAGVKLLEQCSRRWRLHLL